MTAVEPPERDLARSAGAPAVERSKRMLVIFNPHATATSDALKRRVVSALEGRYDVEAVHTQHKGHAIVLCRGAANDGYDVVVTLGGDGTINEAANGLAGSGTPLACLPGGSANVFCRILGIPNDVMAATERLVRRADDWRPRRVDLARVNDRWFTFSAGVGLDASVVERVDRHPGLKATLGSWYFAHSAVATFLRRYVVRPPRLEVSVDGRSHTGVSAMVQNAHPYTYFRDRPIDLAEGAELHSGDLAGVVLTRANPVDMPTVVWRAFSRRARMVEHRHVVHFNGARDLRMRSLDGRPIPLQVDGDHIGEAREAQFTVAQAALSVLC